MTAPRWTAEQAAEHQARIANDARILADAYREQHPVGPRTRKPKRERAPLEHAEQVELIRWARTDGIAQWPELGLLHAIPNGGHRSKATAARMKREGQLAGVPDLALPVARGGYHGLYVELKRADRIGEKSEGLSDEQAKIIPALRANGYRVEVAFGWHDARARIEAYLQLEV